MFFYVGLQLTIHDKMNKYRAWSGLISNHIWDDIEVILNCKSIIG